MNRAYYNENRSSHASQPGTFALQEMGAPKSQRAEPAYGKSDSLSRQPDRHFGQFDDNSEHDSGDDNSNSSVNAYIISVFIFEFLLLAGLWVLCCFLRFTDKFNVREQTFACEDSSLSHPYIDPKDSNIYIPELTLYLVGFILPVVLIFIGELFFLFFSKSPSRTIVACAPSCKLPLPLRRILRNTGMFLLGVSLTWIFTDVLKITVGRLRPYWLDLCEPDVANCKVMYEEGMAEEDICLYKTLENDTLLRDARMSFPSLYASFSMYSMVYAAIYVHFIMSLCYVRLMRPILVFGLISLSLFAGISRLQDYRNFPADVFVGFFLGAAIAIYLGVFCLNNFKENTRATVKHEAEAMEKSDDEYDDVKPMHADNPAFSPSPKPSPQNRHRPSDEEYYHDARSAYYTADPRPSYPQANRTFPSAARGSPGRQLW